MKKEEPKSEIIFVRTTKSVKEFIKKLALNHFGSKRKEAQVVNKIFEELRDYNKVSVNDK